MVTINAVKLMYINGEETPVTQEFNAVTDGGYNNVSREQVTTLSRRIYEHKYGTRREWDIVISANELYGEDNDKLEFLEQFWIAEKRYRRWDSVETEDIAEMTVTRVVTADGRSPREQLRGNKHLSQFKLTLVESLT